MHKNRKLFTSHVVIEGTCLLALADSDTPLHTVPITTQMINIPPALSNALHPVKVGAVV